MLLARARYPRSPVVGFVLARAERPKSTGFLSHVRTRTALLVTDLKATGIRPSEVFCKYSRRRQSAGKQSINLFCKSSTRTCLKYNRLKVALVRPAYTSQPKTPLAYIYKSLILKELRQIMNIEGYKRGEWIGL